MAWIRWVCFGVVVALVGACGVVPPRYGGLTTLDPHALGAFDDVFELVDWTTTTGYADPFDLSDPSGIVQAAHHGLHYCRLVSGGQWRQLARHDPGRFDVQAPASPIGVVRAARFLDAVLEGTGDFRCDKNGAGLWGLFVDPVLHFTGVGEGVAVVQVTPWTPESIAAEREAKARERERVRKEAEALAVLEAEQKARERRELAEQRAQAHAALEGMTFGTLICKRGKFQQSYLADPMRGLRPDNVRTEETSGWIVAEYWGRGWGYHGIVVIIREVQPDKSMRKPERWPLRFDQKLITINRRLHDDGARWIECNGKRLEKLAPTHADLGRRGESILTTVQ